MPAAAGHERTYHMVALFSAAAAGVVHHRVAPEQVRVSGAATRSVEMLFRSVHDDTAHQGRHLPVARVIGILA